MVGICNDTWTVAFNPFTHATLFLGGRDVVRMALASTELQGALTGVPLDLHTAFGADCRLKAPALLALANFKHSYHIVSARIHTGAVTQSGGAELVALSASQHLRVLDLSHCSGLKYVNALGSCGLLEELSLSWCGDLAQINGLGRCTYLKVLNLSSCGCLEDVSALHTCSCLQALVLSFCNAIQISTLPTLPITSLTWAGSQLETCGVLSRCPGLLKLNLAKSDKLVNIEALSSCPFLQDLDLFSCGRLSSVHGLHLLQHLEALNLNTCMHLESIGPLADLSKLQKLDLNRCWKIQDFMPLERCGSLHSISLHGCKVTPDIDVRCFGSVHCAVSTSADAPLPGSFACFSQAAATSAIQKGIGLGPTKCSSTCSTFEQTLQYLCARIRFAVGILWEDRHGLLCFAGASVLDEHKKFGHAFVQGSRCCSFRPSVGSPGRALSNGVDWIDDVQQLDATSFPRQPAAVASGMHTVFGVAVPGGVAEFISHEVLSKSDTVLREVATRFGSAVRIR